MSWTHVILKSQVNLEQVHFGVCSVLTLTSVGEFSWTQKEAKVFAIITKRGSPCFSYNFIPLIKSVISLQFIYIITIINKN